jgi:hypothetical protein
MSLTVDKISDGTTEVDAGYVINGAAKAWVEFDSNPSVVENTSLNVSSLTDNGTGDVTTNFVTSFDTQYHAGGGMSSGQHLRYVAGSASMDFVRTQSLNSGHNASDENKNSVLVMGELA